MVAMWESRTPPDSLEAARVVRPGPFFSRHVGGRLDAQLVAQTSKVAGHRDDARAPRIERGTSGSDIRDVTGVEAAEQSCVSLAEMPPRVDVSLVYRADLRGRGLDGHDSPEVGGDA